MLVVAMEHNLTMSLFSYNRLAQDYYYSGGF